MTNHISKYKLIIDGSTYHETSALNQGNRIEENHLKSSQTDSDRIGLHATYENHGPSMLQQKSGSNFRFALTSLVLAVLALLSVYLEYVVYPSIMSSQYGETEIQLHLSILTYWFSAKNCVVSSSCLNIPGVPAFDFVQLFLLLLVLTLVYHFARSGRTA